MINGIFDIWKIAVQAIMFLVLWAAVFSVRKGKKDSIAAVLLILVNIGIGLLPCAGWVRYGVSAFAIIGYAGICYKKQIGKAVFVILAFYNLHCLGYLMASSMCMVRCPACKGRICDLIATAGGRVVLKVKCPECGRIVKLEWLLQVTETAK